MTRRDLEQLKSRMLPGETVEVTMMRLGWTVEEEPELIDNRSQVAQLADRIDDLSDEIHELAAAVQLPSTSKGDIAALHEAEERLAIAIATLIDSLATVLTSSPRVERLQ